MTKYKVKNIINGSAEGLQNEIKQWIESRKHICICNINTWSQNNISYTTIIYTENEYNL